MKQKLRKHRFSVFFAFFWTALGLSFWYLGVITWWPGFFEGPLEHTALPLISGGLLAYFAAAFMLARIRAHAYGLKAFVVVALVSVAWVVLFVSLAAARVYFSLSFLLFSFLFTLAWYALEMLLRQRYANYHFYLVPGSTHSFKSQYRNILFHRIPGSAHIPHHADAVVVDFNRTLGKEWLAFISRCILKGVPVISTDDLVETEEGRIILEHLTSANSINFQRFTPYVYLKRLADILLVLLFSPVWVPLMLLFMLLVRIESPGPVIFTQIRVGKSGKTFRIYKIRSMCVDSEKKGAAFAGKGDARVTRIGAFIRKYRIDEFPQFFNILMGQMSLVGPRPEQEVFVKEFEESIPYYQLRHIVAPGITGWAQVNQGYAAGTSETSEKLALDLYYVKHLSFTVDLLICLKTIATILTGFGAR